ncbi:MAG TPA: hypothetical protein VK457_15300 [Chloroflexota bacterium]|nr:hypothetical protein [Chloroflexota bacterium]
MESSAVTIAEVHTATSMAGAPLAFDSGGLAFSKSSQTTFVLPGTYRYASAIDCFGSRPVGDFNCGPYDVIVIGS